MTTKVDYYEVRECERTADDATIKSRYRKLAMQYHPDRNAGCKDSEAKFKAISEAYDCLKDPQKRAAYDRYGHAAFQQGMGGGGGGHGAQDFGAFSDIFESVFGEFMGGGRGGGRQQPRRGADLRYDMEITLEEAFHGKQTEITVDVSAACDTCDGTGAKAGTGQDLPTVRRPWQGPCATGLFRGRADLPGLSGRGPDHRRSLPRLSRRRSRREDQDAGRQRARRRRRGHPHPPVR